MPGSRSSKTTPTATSAAKLGFEGSLWAAANALRGSMDAAEYKHVVLGLIFAECFSGLPENCSRNSLTDPKALKT